MEKMSLLKLMYAQIMAQIMANDNNIIMAYIPIIYMNVEDQNLIPIIQLRIKIQ